MSQDSELTSLILGQTEVYNCETQRIWAWHKVSDVVEGIELRLSNMAGGFPFEAAGHTWASSEQLYLSGEFTDPNIQEELAKAKSGYAAKRFIKSKYKKAVRSDYPEFRLQWMLWCVWQKCLGNETFRKLLTSIPDDAILVEDTTTDKGGTAEIWGAKKCITRTNQGNERMDLIGQNNIGKILMICRHCLTTGTEPEIDYTLLNSARITIFNKVLTFKSGRKIQA